MIIIRTIDTSQQMKIIPRVLTENIRLNLVDKEDNRNNIDSNIIATINNEFLEIPYSATFFKEGRKYFIRVYDYLDNILWTGLGFCTDQTDLQNFNING